MNEELERRQAIKELRRASNKCLEDEKKQAQLAMQAMNANNPALARIYAQNSTRSKHLAERYLRMAAHLESIHSVNTLIKSAAVVTAK